MRPTLFLRIASVLTLIHAILHTMGGVFGKPKGPEEALVVETMKAHHFLVMGSARTYWDFFFGYGLFVTIALLSQAIIFWQMGEIIETQPRLIRPIMITFLVTYIAVGINSANYFFFGPAVTEWLIALCLLVAMVRRGAAQPALSAAASS